MLMLSIQLLNQSSLKSFLVRCGNSIYFIIRCWNIDDRRYFQMFEYWWFFFKIYVIETNLDSIILCELEIFVDRDLSIIGRVRLVKKTRQSWWQKVGVILKVDWHCRIKSNWIVLTTVRFMQQLNGQFYHPRSYSYSPENGQLY